MFRAPRCWACHARQCCSLFRRARGGCRESASPSRAAVPHRVPQAIQRGDGQGISSPHGRSRHYSCGRSRCSRSSISSRTTPSSSIAPPRGFVMSLPASLHLQGARAGGRGKASPAGGRRAHQMGGRVLRLRRQRDAPVQVPVEQGKPPSRQNADSSRSSSYGSLRLSSSPCPSRDLSPVVRPPSAPAHYFNASRLRPPPPSDDLRHAREKPRR